MNDSFSGKPYDYWQVIEISIEWKDDAHAINVADIQGIITSYRTTDLHLYQRLHRIGNIQAEKMKKIKLTTLFASLVVLSVLAGCGKEDSASMTATETDKVTAALGLSVFPVFVFLIPGLVAAYYQRKHGLRFEKPQRKSISAWYVGINSAIGMIPLAILVSETKDQLNEPFSQVLMALVFAIIALVVLAYMVVYWVIGMDFSPNNSRS